MAEPDWREQLYTLVAMIPPGTTTSYGALAQQISGASARSVARAMSQLPEGTRLPWHRVIRADGRLPDHPGRDEQAQRLRAEGVFIR
ncbi:cysteine methyltransferase [Natronospirillum operosum]|uniref:Cysteine methyltransferase n=1 Tax=Natronospirillum operosum TaxID=2759953 RepID=A0A4Z0W9X8_9GAMM|nr:MGMT family protein [Natronospirillum operosum]TGG90317.1 cysteine methyltransferase [Natronospirillum operosum]